MKSNGDDGVSSWSLELLVFYSYRMSVGFVDVHQS
jgi:hypothetical protein